jgi:flavorubredoxin
MILMLKEDLTMGSNTFKAVQVSPHVHWVGAVDWEVRDFHGYLTRRGTTYNAYLVMAEKITLMDTVKAPFRDEMLARVASVIDPRDVSYLISNHAEMDHSGSLPGIIEATEPEKVFASPRGVKALDGHYHMGREITPVRDGESLSLGDLTVSFIETPMIHWPDSMWTYLSEDELIFSNDAFGMHLASAERFADELDANIMEEEVAKYYANILTLYAPLIEKLVARYQELNLSVKTIAPDHGPIWRKDLDTIIGWYVKWTQQAPTRKAVVVYDTMWHSTAAMAQAVGEGLAAGGASPTLMSLKSCHRSDVATEVLRSGALVVGSPTINNELFPTVADVLTYLKGLKFKNLVGAAFGSFGWSGEAVKHIESTLQEMKVELAAESVKVKYVPDEAALVQCRALGESVAKRLVEIC